MTEEGDAAHNGTKMRRSTSSLADRVVNIEHLYSEAFGSEKFHKDLHSEETAQGSDQDAYADNDEGIDYNSSNDSDSGNDYNSVNDDNSGDDAEGLDRELSKQLTMVAKYISRDTSGDDAEGLDRKLSKKLSMVAKYISRDTLSEKDKGLSEELPTIESEDEVAMADIESEGEVGMADSDEDEETRAKLDWQKLVKLTWEHYKSRDLFDAIKARIDSALIELERKIQREENRRRRFTCVFLEHVEAKLQESLLTHHYRGGDLGVIDITACLPTIESVYPGRDVAGSSLATYPSRALDYRQMQSGVSYKQGNRQISVGSSEFATLATYPSRALDYRQMQSHVSYKQGNRQISIGSSEFANELQSTMLGVPLTHQSIRTYVRMKNNGIMPAVTNRVDFYQREKATLEARSLQVMSLAEKREKERNDKLLMRFGIHDINLLHSRHRAGDESDITDGEESIAMGEGCCPLIGDNDGKKQREKIRSKQAKRARLLKIGILPGGLSATRLSPPPSPKRAEESEPSHSDSDDLLNDFETYQEDMDEVAGWKINGPSSSHQQNSRKPSGGKTDRNEHSISFSDDVFVNGDVPSTPNGVSKIYTTKTTLPSSVPGRASRVVTEYWQLVADRENSLWVFRGRNTE